MIGGLFAYLKGLLRGLFGKDHPSEHAVAVGVVGDGRFPAYDVYPSAPPILQRFPKYPLGAKLKRGPVVGIVHTIYADYEATISAFIVPHGWFEKQEDPPSSKDQVFYGITVVAKWKGRVIVMGAILVGENDVELASDEDIREPVEA